MPVHDIGLTGICWSLALFSLTNLTKTWQKSFLVQGVAVGITATLENESLVKLSIYFGSDLKAHIYTST